MWRRYHLVANLAHCVVLLLVGFFESEVFPYKRTFSTLFVDQTGVALPLFFHSRCFLNTASHHTHNSPASLYSCLRVSASQQGRFECFGGRTELRMRVSFRKSLGILYHEKWQINRFNSIILVWRSFDPKIEITIKIQLIAQPNQTGSVKPNIVWI